MLLGVSGSVLGGIPKLDSAFIPGLNGAEVVGFAKELSVLLLGAAVMKALGLDAKEENPPEVGPGLSPVRLGDPKALAFGALKPD